MDQPVNNFLPLIIYPPNATLEQRFAIEANVYSKKFKPMIVIELSFWKAWSLLAALQLACRHPFFIGPTRWIAEGLARDIESKITPLPALKEIAKRGWDPKFDQDLKVRRCRVCGCTDGDCRQCIEKTGVPCTWVEEDLCSACAGRKP